MHIEAKNFTLFVKSVVPGAFIGKKVIDIGGGDINGNNRHLFTDCEYDANDVMNARNVTIVSKTKDLPFGSGTFDTIVSTECFEHDPEYKESFLKIYDMLKPGGVFLFTCGGTGRGEHGTRRTNIHDNYGAKAGLADMVDHYRNIDEIDLDETLGLDESFSSWDTYYDSTRRDLYFVGIKKGGEKIELPIYVAPDTMNTSKHIKNVQYIRTIVNEARVPLIL
jgi:SAM-dependent methyltransferase